MSVSLTLKQDIWIAGVKQLSGSTIVVDESFAAVLIAENKANIPVGYNIYGNISQPIIASRDASLSDLDKILECNSASAINITIPPAATTNFPNGTLLTIYQEGVGASLFVAGSGVTIQGTAPTATQYIHIAVRKRSGNTWAWV